MVHLQNHRTPKVYLRYQQYKLDHESPSAVQFTLNSEESRHDLVKSHGRRGYYYLYRQLPITGPAVQIDGLPLGHNSVGHSLISNQMLSQLPMEDKDRGLLTHQMCLTVDALIDRKDTTEGTNKLWLIDVKIQLVTLVEEEGERAADYERRYMRGSNVRPNYNGMIPATWSSIAHLEQVILLHNNGGKSKESSSCPICLGDLPAASYVTRMPCLHVFHVKCIVKWLTGSHYCPICRFQMPT